MADDFDLKQAVGRVAKIIDAKAFPGLDGFVKETDKLREEVDEIHRARNKILTSISRGAVDDRAVKTYDKLTGSVEKDAVKLRQSLAKLQTAANAQIKDMKKAKNVAALKGLDEIDARLDKVGTFLGAQKNFPDSEQWLLASLRGVEADSGPGTRKGADAAGPLPALKHDVKIASNAPGDSLKAEIAWFEKNADDVDLGSLKKVRGVLPKVDAAVHLHDKLKPQIKAYLAYLTNPAGGTEPADGVLKALDSLVDQALLATRILDEMAVAVKKIPRKTPRAKAAAQALLGGVEEAGGIVTEMWQSLRPSGTGWTPKPRENVARAKANRAKLAEAVR